MIENHIAQIGAAPDTPAGIGAQIYNAGDVPLADFRLAGGAALEIDGERQAVEVVIVDLEFGRSTGEQFGRGVQRLGWRRGPAVIPPTCGGSTSSRATRCPLLPTAESTSAMSARP